MPPSPYTGMEMAAFLCTGGFRGYLPAFVTLRAETPVADHTDKTAAGRVGAGIQATDQFGRFTVMVFKYQL